MTVPEEPDVWESRLSGSVRGRSATASMDEILWHRRKSRRQTEKTNIVLQLRGDSCLLEGRCIEHETPRSTGTWR